MQKEAIETSKAPKAIGPYSQAIAVGGWIFTSGQIPIDPSTNELIIGGFESQVKRVLINMQEVLKEAGASLDNVVKVTVYLTDLKQFSVFNEIYQSFLKPPYPSRSTVQAAALPKGALIEIDAIAYKE